jgi:CubicO group peptidase (beta-lactamase class C family)
MAVRTRRTHLRPSVGSYGWNGGYGIIWYNDPAEDMTAILMNQGGAGRPTSPVFLDFFAAAYQAIDD